MLTVPKTADTLEVPPATLSPLTERSQVRRSLWDRPTGSSHVLIEAPGASPSVSPRGHLGFPENFPEGVGADSPRVFPLRPSFEPRRGHEPTTNQGLSLGTIRLVDARSTDEACKSAGYARSVPRACQGCAQDRPQDGPKACLARAVGVGARVSGHLFFSIRLTGTPTATPQVHLRSHTALLR